MKKLLNILKSIREGISYTIFLSIYLLFKLFEWFFSLRIFPNSLVLKLKNIQESVFKFLDFLLPRRHGIKITQLDLIDMSFKTLVFKKTRTFITIGGMTMGIGIIVLLVSIGYGLQDYVISRVTTLDELKRVDISTLVGNRVNLDEQALLNFREIRGVEKVLPVISLIAKVSYEGSESTVVAYGIKPEYLSLSWRESTNISTNSKAEVLGESESLAENLSNTLELITLAEDNQDDSSLQTIPLGENIQREIIINNQMEKLLGLENKDVESKVIKISFTVPSELLGEQRGGIQTDIGEYKITGVVAQGNTPILYFPIENLSSLQLENYSSVRIILTEQSEVTQVRAKIEGMGFKTSSVLDTINQIESFFYNVRFFLTLLGMIALFVASLGIFNTLTVSLLERTQEIGLLKVMGMESVEVKNLFLTESLLLAIAGCFTGLFFGFLSGKFLSFLLSIVVLPTNSGWIDISRIPLSLVVLVVVLSVIVGLVTGLYPSRRAKRIPALNALRYE